MTLLGFKIDSPKIHDNVDVVQVANEMKPCVVKNLSSTHGDVFSKRKSKYSAKNLSAALQAVNNPLENKVGIHE